MGAAAAINGGMGLDQKRIDDILEWLEPDPAAATYTDADLKAFEAFGFKPPTR